MEQNENVETTAKSAMKRIPVAYATWRKLWTLRNPGETFDSVCQRAIEALKNVPVTKEE